MVTTSWLLAAWVQWGGPNPSQMWSHCCPCCYHWCQIPPPGPHCHHQLMLACTAVSDGAQSQCWLWSSLGTGHKQCPGGNGMFTGGLPLCLHSPPLSHTTGKRTDHFAISGSWGNGFPLCPWSWAIQWEGPPRRNGCPLGNFLPHSEWSGGLFGQSTPAEPCRHQTPEAAEMAISLKVWERLWDPSWS